MKKQLIKNALKLSFTVMLTISVIAVIYWQLSSFEKARNFFIAALAGHIAMMPYIIYQNYRKLREY